MFEKHEFLGEGGILGHPPLQLLHLLNISKYCSFIYILEVEDVANTVLFLLSDNSAMINCETILVDGGYCAC